MAPIHHFAFCGNIKQVTDLLKMETNIINVLNKDEKDESALHSCARGGRENATKIAFLLINSIDSKSRTDFVNLENSNGKTAIYYAVECSAETLVGYLLDQGATIPPEDQKVSQGNSLTHLAAVNGSVGILKLLIGNGFPACTIEDGQTPLHICAQNEDSQNNAACVAFLASVYSSPEINFPRQSDRRTVLHMLSDSCSVLMLKAVLNQNQKIKLLLLDSSKRTALDLAVESCQNKNAEQCVDLLMKVGVNSSDVQRTKFLEMFSASYTDSSPLDIAIQFRSARIVKAIVTNLPDRQNWIESSRNDFKQHLANIYKVTPEALPPLMTQCLELSTHGESVEADFGPISGYSPTDAIQSKHLHKLLQNKNTKRARKAVLLHPLVQLYVQQRWMQLRHLNWIALGIRIIWLLIYTLLVQAKYDTTTCDPSKTHDDLLMWLNPTFACNDGIQKTLTTIFLIYTVLLGLNEIFRLVHDWRSLISYFKMANVILAFITGIGCFIESPHIVFFNAAAFGFLVAFLMVSQEFAKRGHTEIAAFGKVVYRTCFLALFVIVVLFAFRIGFKILLPSLKDQLEGPVQGFVKVLVLMTGEYDYKDIFHEGGQETPSSGGSLLFFMFVIIVTIALANLLTAFAVDDTERLMRDARTYITETRLEQIHQWEILLRWSEQKGINFFSLLMKASPWDNSGELILIPVEEAISSVGGDENIIDGLRAESRGVRKYSDQNGLPNVNGEADTKC